MNLLLLGLTLGTSGKLVLGLAVLRAHMHIVHEHKIDGVVLQAMTRERYVTLLGLALILVGYILEVMFYSSATDFLTCVGPECVAAVNAVFNN